MGVWSKLFKRKRKPTGDSELASELLRHIYSKKITGTNDCEVEVLSYFPQDKKITFRLKSPQIKYTNEKIDEVTTNLHVFVLGELAYIFVYFLVRDGISKFVTSEEYIRLADDYKLKFSGINLRIKKSYPVADEYIVELELKKEIPRKEVIDEGLKQTVAISITQCFIKRLDGKQFAEAEIYNSAILKEEKITEEKA